MSRIEAATRLSFREQARHPLLLILLVALPFFFITRAIASTVPQPRDVPLPGGGIVMTNMQDIHGATMTAITVAFLAGLCGLFILQSAREADRRLVLAGFSPAEAIVPRLLTLLAATGLVVAVAVIVTALSFQPQAWTPFIAGNLLVGITYGGIGALAGSLLGKLGGTYLMLFLPMIDLGIAQSPMFGDADPNGWAAALPGYGAGRVMVEAGFATDFNAWSSLALAGAWAAVTVLVVTGLLVRSVGIHRAAPA
jgi:hypothetical protein